MKAGKKSDIKGSDDGSEEEDEDIYLKDFIKIFRNDEVGDNLI